LSNQLNAFFPMKVIFHSRGLNSPGGEGWLQRWLFRQRSAQSFRLSTIGRSSNDGSNRSVKFV